ncbi:MAG: hypothetical protein OXH30_15175, partial [Chloroflexi bacterium]|nr:hypothetical protein [Chloroflexota bacterium]
IGDSYSFIYGPDVKFLYRTAATSATAVPHEASVSKAIIAKAPPQPTRANSHPFFSNFAWQSWHR